MLAVLFVTFLDTTIVSVTLGSIQYDLGAGVISLQWVVNAYSLVFAGLLLVAGSLGDRFGRRRVMVVGIAVFCAGSVLGALASGVGALIAGRAVMGIGAAASEPGTLSVIRQLYPDPAERARALGAWAAVSGLSLAAGPVLGGVLVGLAGWRAVFWSNLALGLIVLIATTRLVPESSDPQPGRVDAAGAVSGAFALAALIGGALSGEQSGYDRWWVLALFAGCVLAGIAFVVIERRASVPVLDLRLLADRAIGCALFVAFAAYFGVFAIFFLTALYLDVVVGYSGARLAVLFAPMAVAIVLGAVASGRWVGRSGPRRPMIVGCLLAAAGIVAARYLLLAAPPFAALTAAVALAGLGFGTAVVPLTSAVLGRVPAARSGMAASATNTARQLGSVVGVAALGAIVNGFLTHDFSRDLQERGADQQVVHFVLGLIETGGDAAKHLDLAHPPGIIADLVDAATAAFRTGMHAALLVAAGLILLGALVTALVPESAFDRPVERSSFAFGR